ncbi:hypothetical protein FVEG_16346 [Fusarium verticillioides 7600]|uniref:Uncharacterized protein n=1 Tax=Gibberella moniliformis (strain M3125 / FGSC 7600) TaxID=334819 RepID=W7MM57_GIBM7|nr:hypothetical protein FVEG_16346 [Fusarium verticillioides 7600]EWG48854.1 hypothetical protein FVEG_16346 [Fusarium verticillioides 7600]RBQ96049.1 hypothetical protein FVER53263_20870 [Fusarium verticillioides]RBR13633.1 hypothetical protein FVER53590_25264 [Fusarium verticillioides]
MGIARDCRRIWGGCNTAYITTASTPLFGATVGLLKAGHASAAARVGYTRKRLREYLSRWINKTILGPWI